MYAIPGEEDTDLRAGAHRRQCRRLWWRHVLLRCHDDPHRRLAAVPRLP